jgi:hypothetical protein
MTTSTTAPIRLDPQALAPLLSAYLTKGRKDDCWRIDRVEIEGDRLLAEVSMSSTYASASDPGGFHLTIFSALEFASQLMIIHAHVWAGLESKTREGWMVESTARAVRAIRDSQGIAVRMQVHQLRKRGEHLYCNADFTVTDSQGGLFEIGLKGFLS